MTPYASLEKGTLLIACPEIVDSLFTRSVILLCDHSNIGSFGLILNKPLEVEFPEEIVSPDMLSNPHMQVRNGGILQPNQMMLIHTSSEIPDQTLPLAENVFLGGDLEFLQHAIGSSSGPKLLLCFGYCGWSAGQLEKEFLEGDWFVYPATEALVFDTPPEKMWQTVLREMGGKYATYSMIPEDLSLN